MQSLNTPIQFSDISLKFHYDYPINDTAESMELAIYFNQFKDDAQGWGQLLATPGSKQAYYVEMFIKLIGELAHRTKYCNFPTYITCELIPRKIPIEVIKVPIAVDPDIQICSVQTIQKHFIGLRLRLAVCFNGRGCLGDTLQEFLTQNTRYQSRKRKKAKKFQTILDELNSKVYHEMACYLTGNNYPEEKNYIGQSCLNPSLVFSPVKDALLSFEKGAALECCNGNNYEEEYKQLDKNRNWQTSQFLVFPFDSRYVFRLDVKSLNPVDINRTFLPFFVEGCNERKCYTLKGHKCIKRARTE